MNDRSTTLLLPRLNLFGVCVTPQTLSEAVARINGWIERGGRTYVCVTGVHGIIESRRDVRIREIHNAAGMVTTDGMPLVWLSRRRGFPEAERVYGPDLLLACCAAFLPKRRRHFFFGGAPGVAERLASRLSERFPGLEVAGCFSPPFTPPTPAEDEAIVRRLNGAGADIVWVGLSTPKQEQWMAEHRNRLQSPVLIGVGAAFDFHAGLKPQAPRWIQRGGLEWLFRLLCEPRRLGKRYLVNNAWFLGMLLLESVGARKYE